MTIQTNFDFYICIVDQQHLVDAEQNPLRNFDHLPGNDFLLDDDSSTSSDCYSDDSSLESFDESEDHEGSGMDGDDDDESLGTDSLLISRCRRRRNRTEQTDHISVFSSLRGPRESDENGMFEEDSVRLAMKVIETNTRGRHQRHNNHEDAIPTDLIISLKD